MFRVLGRGFDSRHLHYINNSQQKNLNVGLTDNTQIMRESKRSRGLEDAKASERQTDMDGGLAAQTGLKEQTGCLRLKTDSSHLQSSSQKCIFYLGTSEKPSWLQTAGFC